MLNIFFERASCLFLLLRSRVTVTLLTAAFLLSACASSNVSRDASTKVDMGMYNAEKLGTNFASGDVAESYQNMSQAYKGGILGGAAGAIVGATSTVGFLPGTLAGAILGASYGSYIDTEATLSDRLINRGATMIELGDQIMIVIPSERLFLGMSAKIKPQAYSTLDLVTTYINNYTKTLVKISAYTDDIGEKKVNLVLSRQQARAVGRYLADNGVNARVLYSEGFGATNLVMKNTMDWGKSDNYRIEITMEKLEA